MKLREIETSYEKYIEEKEEFFKKHFGEYKFECHKLDKSEVVMYRFNDGSTWSESIRKKMGKTFITFTNSNLYLSDEATFKNCSKDIQ